jgi:hypothetical protein
MYQYRGTDRRLIFKANQILQRILKRDALALSGKPTTQLSTKQLILDNNAVDPGLKFCAQTLITRLTEIYTEQVGG